VSFSLVYLVTRVTFMSLAIKLSIYIPMIVKI